MRKADVRRFARTGHGFGQRTEPEDGGEILQVASNRHLRRLAAKQERKKQKKGA